MEEYLRGAFGNEWYEFLKEEFRSPWFSELAEAIGAEREKTRVYPPSDDVFRAFRMTPPSRLKVVHLGQDPYNGPGEANGIAFDCRSVKYLAPSWEKVLEEYNKEFPTAFATDLMDGNLDRWCESGVLMINSALTVPHKDPGKHAKLWRPFTSMIIDKLSWEQTPKVFVLLGGQAGAFHTLVRQPHILFRFEHPAAPTYSPYPRPWAADGIFIKINAALKQLGREPINW